MRTLTLIMLVASSLLEVTSVLMWIDGLDPHYVLVSANTAAMFIAWWLYREGRK